MIHWLENTDDGVYCTAFRDSFDCKLDGIVLSTDAPHAWVFVGLDPLSRDWPASFDSWRGIDRVINGWHFVASNSHLDERNDNDDEVWIVEQWSDKPASFGEPVQTRFFF